MGLMGLPISLPPSEKRRENERISCCPWSSVVVGCTSVVLAGFQENLIEDVKQAEGRDLH